ncbi:MAG: LuxR family transcriptional regulator [Telluria sp.]
MVELGQLMTLLKSSTEAAWQASLFSLARSQGFDQVLYGAVGSKHAKFENAFLHSNYSSAWRERYDADKLHYVDPTVAHCVTSSLPIVWEPDTFSTPAQRALYEEASGHGIRSGITFPIHGPSGEFGVVSFASDARPGGALDDDIIRLMPALSLIRDYAFESSLKFLHAQNSAESAPRLTKRELEVLNWVMVGKSSWEISKITVCSEATVNFHIGNIRQKFNVNTRQQALVKAISMGILTPEDHHR